MNTRRLGVALMVVGVVLAATGTFGFGLVDAGRVSPVSAIDDATGPDDSGSAPYVDTVDRTTYATVTGNPTNVLTLYNYFTDDLLGENVSIVHIEPVNSSKQYTTTNESALLVSNGGDGFDDNETDSDGQDVIPVDEKRTTALECNPDYSKTIDAKHEITLHFMLQGQSGDGIISLDKTVTVEVECNV